MTNEQINETKPKTSGLSVQRTVNGKPLDINVQQTWRFETPKEPLMINGKPFNKTSYLFFNFNNIPYDEVEQLAKYTMQNPTVLKQTDKDNDLWHISYVCQDFNNMRQKGTKAVHFALDFFKKKGYEIPSLDVLFKNVVTPEEYLGVVKKADEKWAELLSDLGKPETIELVKKYVERFGKIYMQVYGHQLTFRNAKMILAQKPDATLVMTENNWLKFFNCTVNPNAQKIIYVGRWSDIATKNIDDAQRYADIHGIKFDKTKSEYQGHADYGLEIADSSSWSTCLVVGYDSSEVTPIDKDNDWRLTRFGMKNNLTGEPNKLTTAYYDEIGDELEKKKEEYKRLKNVLNDNARLSFQTIMVMLRQVNPEAFNHIYKKAEQLTKPKQTAASLPQNNLQQEDNDSYYMKLTSEAVNALVEIKLNNDYKIRRDIHRASGKKLISGMILYALGVWDANALSSIGGETIDKKSVIHYSNVLNDILENIETIHNTQVEKIKTMIRDLETSRNQETEPQPQQQYKQVANENISHHLNEMRFSSVTPQQFVNLLKLNVIDSESYSDNILEEELLTEYYEKELNVDDFKNPKNKHYSHVSHEEYINGFPVVYQITDRQNIPSIFKNGFDREFTGSKAGNMYGPGLYTTYRLSSSKENNTKGIYGDTIIKMVVLTKFKNFLIFDTSVAKKVYGKNWHISNQLIRLLGEEQCNRMKAEGIWNRLISRAEFTGEKAYSIWRMIGDERLIQNGVGGFIFRGHNDGYVCVIRDFKSILPIAYSTDGGYTWNDDKFTQETINTVSYDVDNRTFLEKDINKYKDTKKVDTGLNKRINDYILVKTNDGKYNFIDIKKHPLSPINFDSASPFRENGMAYVEITDPKYADIFNGEFKGYVSKNGIHDTQNMEDCTPWNQFKKFLKSTGVLNEEYRVRWCVTESPNKWTKNIITENTMIFNTLKEAQNRLYNVLKKAKGKNVEYASIEEKNQITGLFEYVLKTKSEAN